MSVSATSRPESPVSLLAYFDVLVLVVAAPIMILIGVPAAAYGISVGAWIALRALGVAVDRATATEGLDQRAITIRLVFMLCRLFALAIVVILLRQDEGRNAGITSLGVMVFAFTMSLATSALTRPRKSR